MSDLPAFTRFCAALKLEQGGPLTLETFQLLMLADYFGGATETLIILPKKNGKTTLLAALALYHLIVTPDAECVVGASSRDQATLLFDQAAGFVRRSPGLQQRAVVKGGYRAIRSRRDSGRIRVLAADVDHADGVIPTLALVDELGRHRDAGLYGVFRDGLGPRDGQMVGISAAGDHELTPLGQMRAAAYKLPLIKRVGKHLYAKSDDGGFALHEWALEDTDDLDDMAVVKQVNPASWQTLARLSRRHDSPSMLHWQWARFACGIWLGADERWLAPDVWAAGERDDVIEPGDKITIGFDGSRTGDSTALVGCRLSDGLLQRLAVWEAPKDGREWEVPEGEVDAAIAKTMETHRVVRGYFDPPLWQSEIDAWAGEYGEPAVMRYYTSRTRMMAATERFRTDVVAGRVIHTADELLTKHILNAQIREGRGGYWLKKAYNGSPDKIDLAVAGVLAYEARADAIAAGDGADRKRRELIVF